MDIMNTENRRKHLIRIRNKEGITRLECELKGGASGSLLTVMIMLTIQQYLNGPVASLRLMAQPSLNTFLMNRNRIASRCLNLKLRNEILLESLFQLVSDGLGCVLK